MGTTTRGDQPGAARGRTGRGGRATGGGALPPLSAAPNEHPGYPRPAGVVGRMKPTKARRLLRKMDREHTAEEDARLVAALDALLAESRGAEGRGAEGTGQESGA